MPVWPFGRRGGAAKARNGTQPGVPYNLESAGGDALRRSASRRSKRPKRKASNSASMRDPDASSPDASPIDAPFEKSFEKKYPLPRRSMEGITALPNSKQLEASPHLRPVTGNHGPYNFQTTSHSSLAKERGKLQRPQSLRKSVTDKDPGLSRRKSSKRRKNDHVREEEIRAMSMPLPQKRPAGSGYGMLRRESKKIKGGLNRKFERPTSDISLPVEDSIHSSMSSGSESLEFRVSTFDMLSPRPKIRFSVGSQYYYDGTGDASTRPRRANSKREHKLSFEKEILTDGKRSQRIDDLADTLDAGALREILERDKRRRERKRKANEEKLRRKLERRAEKQRETERPGTPGAAGPESTGIIGLGIEKDVATPMEDVQHTTPPQPDQIQTTSPAIQSGAQDQPLPTPVESPVETPVVANAQAVRYSRASLSSASPGHARASSNISQMPELPSEIAARSAPVETVETSEDPRTSGPIHPIESVTTAETVSQKGTGRRRSSEGRRMRMWAAIFRRSKRKSSEQMRKPPSEASFSNTSRESMARQPLPAHLVAPPPVAQIRRPSGAPARTMSKFREDLPEYPLSPPDSRIQSPEVETPNPIAARRGSRPLSNIRIDSESPTNDASTADNETRPSLRTDSPVSPTVAATGLMSQSLASIDSEGSWLSGKPVKRRSNKSHVRSSIGSGNTAARHLDDFTNSYEELGIPDDEYFRRLTPQAEESRRSGHSSGDVVFGRKASSTAIAAMSTTAESDDESPRMESSRGVGGEGEEDESVESGEKLVKDNVERRPTVVHRQPRVKSTEGLLSYYTADEPSPEEPEQPTSSENAARDGEAEAMDLDSPPDSPSSESNIEPVMVQRARSVDLGKQHVRHLSAGSARLLDIVGKRRSVDSSKRLSGSEVHQNQNQGLSS